jgi:hypothetical protein
LQKVLVSDDVDHNGQFGISVGRLLKTITFFTPMIHVLFEGGLAAVDVQEKDDLKDLPGLH